MYFGNLKLKEAAQEFVGCARYGDADVVVLVVDAKYDGAHCFAFAEKVAGDGFALGEKELVFL